MWSVSDLITTCIYPYNSACGSIWDKSHKDLENNSQIQRADAHKQPLRHSGVISCICRLQISFLLKADIMHVSNTQ